MSAPPSIDDRLVTEIAEQTQAPKEQVASLLATEMQAIEPARVKQFVRVIAIRRVKQRLRAMRNQQRVAPPAHKRTSSR